MPSRSSFLPSAHLPASPPSSDEDPADREPSEDDTAPLLPVTVVQSQDGTPGPPKRSRSWRSCNRSRGEVIALLAAWTLGILIGVVLAIYSRRPPPLPYYAPNPGPPTPLHALVAVEVTALHAAQATTLEQASARYTLLTGRAPPPGFDRWFAFARDRGSLTDMEQYKQVWRDFKVFYDIAREDAGYFRRMVESAWANTREKDSWIVRVTIQGGKATFEGHTAYDNEWPVTFKRFSEILPDMTVLINGRDEPRVAFNYRDRAAQRTYRAPSTNPKSDSFSIDPHPTKDWFGERSGCQIPVEKQGLWRDGNEFSGFMLSAVFPSWTTELYPLLSMNKVSPCFADILFPTEFYYVHAWWYQPFQFDDNIPWEEKKNVAYWRGGANSGVILSPIDYHAFPRFKLADVSRANPALIDAHITTFPVGETHCYPKQGCNLSAILEEYNIGGKRDAREDLYRYKYAIDVDGAAFSGRFWGLLRSGSLVFKSTIFEEFFNDWVRPYEHYIPILPDLSDLVEKIEWANANLEEARLIQLRGLEVGRRVLSSEQNDCYYALVLLHWAELMDMSGAVNGDGGTM